MVRKLVNLYGNLHFLALKLPSFPDTNLSTYIFNPVQFSRSVVSDFATHGPQHARHPCPSPAPGVYPNSCPVSRWCHLAISSCHPLLLPPSVLPSQLFTSGGQSIGASASASVLPMNIQDWSLLEWTGWMSLQSKGLSRVFSNTTVQKHQFFSAQLSL